MLGIKPDCELCEMPQEIRWPENRTENASEEVIKFLNLNSSLPSYSSRGLSDLAFLIHWGEVNETDFELLDVGFRTCDTVLYDYSKEKRQDKHGQLNIRDPFK